MIEQEYNLTILSQDEKHTFELATTSGAIIPVSLDGLLALVSPVDGQRGPTKTELTKFVDTCIGQRANPYANECGLMPVFAGGFHYEVWVAASVRMRKAQSQKDYRGYSWGWITNDMTRHNPGRTSKANPDDIVGAWGEVYRENREPYYHEVFLKEFAKPTKSGKGKWETSPVTMLAKVIRDQTHKFGYSDQMGNLSTLDELSAYNQQNQLEPPQETTPPRAARRRPVEATEVPPAEDQQAPTTPEIDTEVDAGTEPAGGPVDATNVLEPTLESVADRCRRLMLQLMDIYGKPHDAKERGDDFINFCSGALACPPEDVDHRSKFTDAMLDVIEEKLGEFGGA